MKVFRLSLLGALALMLLLASAAFAHAKFDHSDPAPDSVLTAAPQEVKIWFTEELDTKLSNIKVLDATNAQVDLGNSKVNLDGRKQMSVGLKQPLSNGVYTVKWHSVSDEDKDELDGDFKFTVRTASATLPAYPQPPTVASPTPQPTAAPTSVPAPTVASSPTPLPPTATPVPPTATSGPDLALPLIAASVVVLGAGALMVLRKK